MRNTYFMSILHFEAGDIALPLQNHNCPIWVEGSPSDKNISILEFSTKMATGTVSLVDALQLTDSMAPPFNPVLGVPYRLSVSDVEIFKTLSLNYHLPIWQEARLGIDDAANEVKALLMWLAYWTDYAINKGVAPYLYFGIPT